MLEQGVVLHVAGADLDDVRHLEHLVEAFGIHGLGDDQEPGFLARTGQQLEAGSAQSLEGVRRAPGLEGAGAEHRRAGVADRAGGVQDLALTLDRAGPRHHDHVVAADGQAAGQADDRGLGLPLPGDLLVWLGDVDDLLHTREGRQPGAVHPTIVAHQADRRTLLAGHRARVVAHLLDGGDHPVDVLLRARRGA